MSGFVDSGIDKAFKEYVEDLFDTDSGFVEPKRDLQALTYGETTWQGVQKIIRNLDLKDSDVFFDFGSGIGKITFQFFMSTYIKAAFGIELMQERYIQSVRGLRQMRQEIPELFDDNRRIKFYNGSIFDQNVSNGTIVYACSTCFTDTMLLKIGRLTNKMPKLRYLIALDAIPNTKLTLDQIIKIKCSWDRYAECYIYALDE